MSPATESRCLGLFFTVVGLEGAQVVTSREQAKVLRNPSRTRPRLVIKAITFIPLSLKLFFCRTNSIFPWKRGTALLPLFFVIRFQ